MHLHCCFMFRGLFLHTHSAFSFAARPDNLATGREKQTHIAKKQQQLHNKDKSLSLQTENRHLVSIQRLRLSEEFHSRFALHIRRRRCTASISSRIPTQKQSRARRCAHVGGTRSLLQSCVPRLLNSSMHRWSHWKCVLFLLPRHLRFRITHTLCSALWGHKLPCKWPADTNGHMYEMYSLLLAHWDACAETCTAEPMSFA